MNRAEPTMIEWGRAHGCGPGSTSWEMEYRRRAERDERLARIERAKRADYEPAPTGGITVAEARRQLLARHFPPTTTAPSTQAPSSTTTAPATTTTRGTTAPPRITPRRIISGPTRTRYGGNDCTESVLDIGGIRYFVREFDQVIGNGISRHVYRIGGE